MIHSVSLVLHRDACNLLLLDPVLVHVPPHLQRENPQQRCAKRPLENLVEYTPESVLRMRMQGRHFLLGNAETSIVHSRGNVPESADRREDSSSPSDVDALVGLTYPTHPVQEVFSLHVHAVESVRC